MRQVFKSIAKNRMISIATGLVIGVSGYHYYTTTSHYAAHFGSDRLSALSQSDPEMAVQVVEKAFNSSSIVRDSLAVRSTLSATQFGKEFHDKFSKGRRSIIAHPYDKQGSGVTATVTYTDASTGEIHVLLTQKLNTRNKPELGLQNIYRLTAGYTKGGPVEGSKASILSYEEEELRDAREDSFVQSGEIADLVTKPSSTSNDEDRYVTKDDFDKITHVMNIFYRQQIEKNPYLRLVNPSVAKDYLQAQGIRFNRDFNELDTSLREFLEETGYNGKITPDMVKHVYCTDNYAGDNIPNLHTKVSNISIDFGVLAKAPMIYPASHTGARETGSFQPNGSEIGKITWASADKITAMPSDQSLLVSYDKTPIGLYPTAILNNVIKDVRDKQVGQATLNKDGHPVFASRAAVLAALENYGIEPVNLLGIAPLNEFGEDARRYHFQVMQAGRCLQEHAAKGTAISEEAILKFLKDNNKSRSVTINQRDSFAR